MSKVLWFIGLIIIGCGRYSFAQDEKDWQKEYRKHQHEQQKRQAEHEREKLKKEAEQKRERFKKEAEKWREATKKQREKGRYDEESDDEDERPYARNTSPPMEIAPARSTRRPMPVW